MDALKFDEEDIPFLQARIDRLPPGTYELSEILGDYWDLAESKTGAGRKFKRLAAKCLLKNIKPGGRTVTNHQRYHVGQ